MTYGRVYQRGCRLPLPGAPSMWKEKPTDETIPSRRETRPHEVYRPCGTSRRGMRYHPRGHRRLVWYARRCLGRRHGSTARSTGPWGHGDTPPLLLIHFLETEKKQKQKQKPMRCRMRVMAMVLARGTDASAYTPRLPPPPPCVMPSGTPHPPCVRLSETRSHRSFCGCCSASVDNIRPPYAMRKTEKRKQKGRRRFYRLLILLNFLPPCCLARPIAVQKRFCCNRLCNTFLPGGMRCEC